jgi:hypothetical protein
MPTREITQFSIVELNLFIKGLEEMGVAFEPTTTKERAMNAFARIWAASTPESMAKFGGCENIQRVRLMGSTGMLIEAAREGDFEYVLKLPLNILEQKRREADRKRREDEVLEKAAELASNPKKYNEFVNRVVKGILGRAAAELLLMSVSAAPVAKKAAQKKHRVEKQKFKPLSKEEAYERAVQQDRRQRIEAAKKGPKSYKYEQPKSNAA